MQGLDMSLYSESGASQLISEWIGSGSSGHPLTGTEPCHEEPRKCSAGFPLQEEGRLARTPGRLGTGPQQK